MLWQQSSEAQTAPDASGENEIVVTAQRRPERSQDVPISLTAISGEQLERMQATDMAGLGKVVPSLNMTRTGAFTQPYLRGIGKRSTLGVENSVATYVDGVYIASSIGALLDLHGIDRVEVLNGPQGTLFGRNTTGGVIQIVTRDPRPEASGEAELAAGDYGYVRGDLYLTGGSDRLAGNLAVSTSHNGGYGTNLFTGKKDVGEISHSLVARSKWIWRPAPSLKLTLAGDYQDVDQDFSYLPVAGYPPVDPPRVQGFRKSDEDASNRMRFRYGGISAKVDAQIGSLNFMSLSALRRSHSRYGSDLDRGPLPLLSAAVVADQGQFSQEFQLQSSESSRVRWVTGLYYIHIDERYDPTTFRYGGSYSTRLGGRLRQLLFDDGKVSSYAAYGQGTLPVGKATQLTLGLRYTIEHRSVDANGYVEFEGAPFVRAIPGLPLPTQPSLHKSLTFEEPTWRASLDHHFSDELMGYLAASRGFQSGGWNLQTPQSPAFGPERLNAFEAGFKFADRSRRFTADANIFHYDYSDLQVSAFTTVGSMTTNAASAAIHGLELQVRAQPDSKIDVTAGFQWLQTRFRSFPNASCIDYDSGAATPYLPISCDVTGNRLPFAPALKFNTGANWHIPLGPIGTVTLSGNLAYNSGYYSEPDNVVRQKPFTTLDVSAQWRPFGEGPAFRLWVLNLSDTHYFESVSPFPTFGVFQNPAAPRRFGISIGYSF